MGKKKGFSFSVKRAVGISSAKGKIAKKTGIPTTKQGRQRKIGRAASGGGCLIPIISILLIILVCCFGCSEENSKYDEGYIRYNGEWITPEEYARRTEVTDYVPLQTQPATSQPVYMFIEIDADDLYQEYDNNQIAADLKYKGKMLKVTGIVQNVSEDILGNPYVIVVGDINDWWGIQCSYPNTQAYRELLAKLNTGESITVTGKCEGYLINVLLKHE